ncbi:hypothetical protein QFC22_005099 [Naganishia vaughanmartiniae]|uniref:Uncharacterized protein n=1 Tax=Naganishia vaughanmartiniae TaxID=1424756 RepID=A0ACC2WX33_9TREE|nr:hypothetical protein QFC22_005099 [Naganishia vaughanmartiniae]
MDSRKDLIESPPSSPKQQQHPGSPLTPTQNRATSKLKRLSLVSGAVFNANDGGIQEGVRDAMEENPSFGSPIRGTFTRSAGNTDTPVVVGPETLTYEVKQSSPVSSPSVRENAGLSIPATRSYAPSTEMASATLDDSLPAPPQQQPQQPPRTSQNIGRIGYRHSTISTSSGRTPQLQASVRRARRRSVDRDPPPLSSNSTDAGNDKTIQQEDESRLALSASSPFASASSSKSSRAHPAAAARPLTLIEQHASLLAYIAQKETEVHESRRLYERRSEELKEAKKKWEEIVGSSAAATVGGPALSQSRSGNGKLSGNGDTKSTMSAAGRIQPPMPIRRTGSSTSSIGSSSSGTRPASHAATTKYDHHLYPNSRAAVLPLTIPLEEGTAAAAGAANAVVEGSKRLFGHLLDSLAGINTGDDDDDDGELYSARGETGGVLGKTGDGAERRQADGRNVLVRLDDSPLRLKSSTERNMDAAKGGPQAGRGTSIDNGNGMAKGPRQIRTLSLIAGKGSTSKHHRPATRVVDPEQSRREVVQEERPETGATMWDMLDTSPPPRSMQTTTQTIPSTGRPNTNSSNRSGRSLSFMDEDDGERGQETPGAGTGGVVDFGNIWDGFAATPNGKDWKAMLAPTYVPSLFVQ